MAKKRKFIITIIIITFIICLAYVDYRFHKAYKGLEMAKEKYGYKTLANNLPMPVFTRGEWQGILIDTDIAYTDGDSNIVPHDLDNDSKVELIANSYRSNALIFYNYDSALYNSSNWSRYVIDSSARAGIPRRPIVKFVKSILKEKILGGFIGAAHYTAIADMNGDGRDDLIVAGDLKRYDVVWYEAPEDINKVSLWKKHIVYKNDSHRTYHVEIGNIDGDGDQYIDFATKSNHYLRWCHCVELSDIDGDGDLDVAVAAAASNVFLLYMNEQIQQH